MAEQKNIILISACLIGMKTTYHGKSNFRRELAELFSRGCVIPVCPEQLGGLPTPRLPSEIENTRTADVVNGSGRVLRRDGVDVTEQFRRGAAEVIRIAQLLKPAYVIFKERSPSCGVHFIYDGTFSNRVVEGEGVTTAVLRRHGYTVFSEEDFEKSPGKEHKTL